MSNRRRDFRVPTAYPVQWRRIDEGDEAPWERSVTKDLSGGGAAISVSPQVCEGCSVGDILEMQIMLPGGPVLCIGRVLRKFREEESKKSFLATEFVSLTAGDKDRIVRIVLSEGLGKYHDESDA